MLYNIKYLVIPALVLGLDRYSHGTKVSQHKHLSPLSVRIEYTLILLLLK